MQPHEIVIKIKPDGSIESTVQGVAGPSCEKLLEWLAELGEVTEEGHTPDYRKQANQTVRTGR